MRNHERSPIIPTSRCHAVIPAPISRDGCAGKQDGSPYCCGDGAPEPKRLARVFSYLPPPLPTFRCCTQTEMDTPETRRYGTKWTRTQRTTVASEASWLDHFPFPLLRTLLLAPNVTSRRCLSLTLDTSGGQEAFPAADQSTQLGKLGVHAGVPTANVTGLDLLINRRPPSELPAVCIGDKRTNSLWECDCGIGTRRGWMTKTCLTCGRSMSFARARRLLALVLLLGLLPGDDQAEAAFQRAVSTCTFVPVKQSWFPPLDGIPKSSRNRACGGRTDNRIIARNFTLLS